MERGNFPSIQIDPLAAHTYDHHALKMSFAA